MNPEMNHLKVAILRFFKRSGASLSTQSVRFSSKNRRRVGYLGLTASKIVNPIYLDAFVPLKRTYMDNLFFSPLMIGIRVR